jgi:hypothetical protein
VRIDQFVIDPDQADRVAAVMGVTPSEDVIPMAVFGERLVELVPTVVSAIAESGPVVPSQVVRSTFGDLEDAGLVDLLEVNGSEISVDRVEVLVLTDRNLDNDPAPMLDRLIALSDPAGPAVPVTVAEVGRVAQDNESPVPSFVGSIRADGRLRDEVSTVDNAETILGWVASVLALEAGGEGSVGHYGFRSGSDGAIPARRP